MVPKYPNKHKQATTLSRMFSGIMMALIAFPYASLPTPTQIADYVFPPQETAVETTEDTTNTIDPEVASMPGFDDWWRGAQQEIVDNEYAPSLQELDAQGTPFPESKWHFFNRTQSLRSYINNDGYELQPSDSSDWSWQYQASTITKGTTQTPIPQTDIASQDNHITIHRQNNVDEWYANSTDGIKQNFTIHQQPKGEGILTLSGVVTTNLTVSGKTNSKITFSHNDTPAFNYTDLLVTDANNTQLPASMHIEETEEGTYTLDLKVDDTNATYPIIIDPLSTTADWTEEINQAEAEFGFSVFTAGDVNGDGYSDVIVGAPLYDNGQADEGGAFVYHGSSTGLATTADWTAESGQASAQMGRSVATAGDVNGDGYSDVIVGARVYDNGEADEGRAFVYHGSSTGLSTTADWTEEPDQASALFGYAVATAGDVNGDGYSDVIVGALQYDNGEADEGRTFVYHGSSTGLSTTADWTAESDQASARFGVSVATAGDVNGDGYADVIVGAFLYTNGQSQEGAAFVYHGSSTGLSATADWSEESDQASAQLGISVSTAGDVNGDGYSDVIVGGYLYDNGELNEGAAFVYHGSSTGLSTTADWTEEADQASAQFGFSVSTAGDINGDGYADVIVGANNYTNGESLEGRAFVYLGSSTGLSATATWTAESDQASASFGYSVSTAGDVNGDGYSDVIVGVYSYDGGETDEGRAYVYYGSASGLATTAAWTGEANQGTARYGFSVAGVGDINGDGYSDVGVGAYNYDSGHTDEGVVFIYHGSSTGLSSSAAVVLEPNQTFSNYGFSVASAGDVNGDGYSDLVVGAPGWDMGTGDHGRAYVYHGSSTGITNSPDWTADSGEGSAQLGVSVASAGDVNGDGYSDVIVGANRFDNGESDEGVAFVYHGSSTGLSTTADWTGEANQASAQFGQFVAGAGDVNGDGYSDVIIGAPLYDNGQSDEGAVFVYHGSSTGLSVTSDWTVESNQASSNFGVSVATAGDVNGDGYSDVVVGARHYDNGQSNEGGAFVYHGSSTGLSTTADWTGESNQANADYGFTAATAGDVNGDGYSDLIVGAALYDNGQADEGRAFVYHGSSTGLSTTADWTREINLNSAHFATRVASAGDVNGDGYSDVVIGAWIYTNGQSQEGGAWVYYGNGGAGLSVAPRQRKADGSSLIQLLNASSSQTEAQLRLLSRVAAGRTDARLIWEVKPFGTPFANTSLGKGSTWTDIGTAGTDITEAISSLTANTPYHWRARFQYYPYLNYSPWFSIGPNAWSEADFRTAADETLPTISTLDPADNATDVAVDTNLTITFNEAVDVETGNITIKRTADDTTFETIDVAGAQVTGTGTTTIVINPGSNLAGETGYYVQIDATAFDDPSGNSFAGIADTTTWNFTTADIANPTISTLDPADNATDVAVDTNLTITFNEAVDVETGNITIKRTADDTTFETIDVAGAQVTGTGTTTITINPGSNLAGETGYYVQIDATAFDDPSGNSFAGIADTTTWNFTTADIANPTISTLDPADNATDVAVDTNLTITFNEAVDVETGNITIKRTADDTTFETIDVAGAQVTGTGTTTIVINPGSNLAGETGYYVQIDATAFDDPSGNSFAGIADTTTWNFTTADIANPTISTLDPADNATDVAVDTNLTITFNEAVDVETGNITIKRTADDTTFETIDVAGAQVTGTGTTTIVINPGSNLAGETGYYVQIDATAFDDPSGNSFAGIADTTTWNFTTADIANPTISTLDPADNATDVAVDTNLTITFNEAVDVETGNITIKRTADDTTFETIDVAGAQVTGTGTTTITINPGSNLAGETGYYVQIDATAFDDPSGNSFAGIADTTTWNFTTAILNNAPSATTPSSISQATDGSGYLTFATTVSDGDNAVTQLQVEYSTDNSTWKQIQVQSAGSSQGDVAIDNNATYQIQSIDTDTGNVTLTVVWASKAQFPDQHEQMVYLRITPFDGDIIGASKTSSAFELDNKAPVVTTFALDDRTNTTFTLSWDPFGSEESFAGYTICYGQVQSDVTNGCINSAQTWDVNDDAALADFTTATTQITGLAKNKTYYLLLKAPDTYGNSVALTLNGIKTSNITPLNLFLDSVVGNSVTIFWDTSLSGTFQKYEVCYDTAQSKVSGNNCLGTKQAITDASITTTTITDLLHAIQYFFTVRIFDTVEKRITSNILGVTTCPAGQTQVNGICVSEPAPTPTPVPVTEPTPTPTPEFEPSPTPTPDTPFLPPPIDDVPPGSSASEGTSAIGSIIETIGDIIEAVIAIVVRIVEIIVDVVVTAAKAAVELVVAVAEAVANTPDQVVPIIREAAERTAEHPATPIVAVATATLATASVIVAIPAIAGTAITLASQLPYYLERLWQGFLGLFGIRRKKRPWGRVINAGTGEPLPGVSIRIVDTENRSGTSALSGPDGSYHSYLPPGRYTLRAFKYGWTLDPKASFLSTLAGEKVYTGEPINVTEEEIVPIVIPMREVQHKVETGIISWRLLSQQIEAILSRVSWPVIAFGVIFNTFTMIGGINLLNGLIELLYVAIIGLKLAVQARYKVSIGRIVDAVTGDPLPLAVIRLYDAVNGRMITTKVTTAEGKFFILAPPGVYTLQVTCSGFTTYRESHVVVESKQSEALAMTLKLEPTQSREIGIQEA